MLAARTGYAVGLRQPPVYSATARLLLADPRPAAIYEDARSGSADPTRYLRNQAELATSRPVLARAGARLGEPVPDTCPNQRVTREG